MVIQIQFVSCTLKLGNMDYTDALIEALTNKEFISEYDRLCGTSLEQCIKAMGTGGLNYQIDLATGRTKDEIQKFDIFFHEFVWSRLPKEAFSN